MDVAAGDLHERPEQRGGPLGHLPDRPLAEHHRVRLVELGREAVRRRRTEDPDHVGQVVQPLEGRRPKTSSRSRKPGEISTRGLVTGSSRSPTSSPGR